MLVKEAADLLEVKPRKVYQLVEDGVIPRYDDPLNRRRFLVSGDAVRNLKRKAEEIRKVAA